MAAVLPNMAPPTLYVEEKKSSNFDLVKSGAPMPNAFCKASIKAPLFLSEVGHKALAIDYSQLPVLSLSLANPVKVEAYQDANFRFTEPVFDMLSASNEMFKGGVALAGDDYDLLCDLLDADALGEIHPLLA